MKRNVLLRFRDDDRGASMLEYAMLASLIVVVAIGSVGWAGDRVKQTFKKVNDAAGGSVLEANTDHGF